MIRKGDSRVPWSGSPEDEKPFQRRLMEVAAGFAEHVDVQAGRVIDEIEKLGCGDNTLTFYVWGDNGSSAEGQNGTISELLAQNGIPTTVKQHIKALDELGGLDVLGSPKTDNQYHGAWGWAGSTPYKGTNILASHFGGTRNPMAIPLTFMVMVSGPAGLGTTYAVSTCSVLESKAVSSSAVLDLRPSDIPH